MRTQRHSIRLTAAFAMIAAAAIGTGTLARTQEAAHHYAGVTGLPTAYFHPNVLYFKVGTMSSQRTTLTNTSAETLKIRSFILQGLQQSDFTFTTSCPFSLAAGASCAVTLTGMPAASGPIGKLVESDNSAAGHHSVLLLAN
jgi:hypothetical protein